MILLVGGELAHWPYPQRAPCRRRADATAALQASASLRQDRAAHPQLDSIALARLPDWLAAASYPPEERRAAG